MHIKLKADLAMDDKEITYGLVNAFEGTRKELLDKMFQHNPRPDK